MWRFVALEVRRGGDEVHVAEPEDGIWREETEDVVEVWVVATGCFGSGGCHPVRRGFGKRIVMLQVCHGCETHSDSEVSTKRWA